MHRPDVRGLNFNQPTERWEGKRILLLSFSMFVGHVLISHHIRIIQRVPIIGNPIVSNKFHWRTAWNLFAPTDIMG
jgi:hypothetical protein